MTVVSDMSRIVRNMLKFKVKIDENQKVPVVFPVLFEPLNEHVPDNSRLPKRVFLFIQEFHYVTIMSDMSRIVRNMFEIRDENQFLCSLNLQIGTIVIFLTLQRTPENIRSVLRRLVACTKLRSQFQNLPNLLKFP